MKSRGQSGRCCGGRTPELAERSDVGAEDRSDEVGGPQGIGTRVSGAGAGLRTAPGKLEEGPIKERHGSPVCTVKLRVSLSPLRDNAGAGCLNPELAF